MITIGIVGGIASGKSIVARCLQEFGAELIDVDKIGHGVLHDSNVKLSVQMRWGEEILQPNGKIDRNHLAAIVFHPRSRQELEFLENLTFPLITDNLANRIEAARAAGKPASVVEAAVMFKAGWHMLCSLIVFVDADRELRLKRSLSRGWIAAQFRDRETAQLPIEYKRAKSDVIIDNNGSIDETYKQTKQFWLSLDQFSPN